MRKIFKYITLSIIFIIPFILWMLPADFFDQGDIVTCPSILFFDTECIGCGLTRAVMHFHHFEFAEGIFYNYGVILIYPLLGFFWVQRTLEGLRMLGVLKSKKLG